MKAVSSGLSEDRKKQIAYCAFGLVVAIYLYFQFFRDPAATVAPPPAPVIVTAPSSPAARVASSDTTNLPAGNIAGKPDRIVGTTSAALDPTLHMDAMLVTESVVYGGTGRNIFSAVSAPAPVVIPKPTAPVRTTAVVAPPPVYRDPGPPPPPPIDLKFCGYFESVATGQKQAILVHGEDAVLASTGEIVLRRYRVMSIAAKSIQIEDMQNNNTQTLPLLAN